MGINRSNASFWTKAAGFAAVFWLALAFALTATMATPARAEQLEATFVPPMPRDLDKVDVYLLTVGRGPQIWALFGHTILRVVDRQSNADYNFNWGIFDFADPKFPWKFYLGDLNYMMVITEFWPLIDDYRNIERRPIREDKLALTNNQKKLLFERLIANSQPENVHYQYSQFRNNCSTKVRDHLDFALGGKINEYIGKKPARVPLRDHIRRSADATWWVMLGLDMASNDLLDRASTAWDEMFLPQGLRNQLALLPAFDDAGKPVPGQNLLQGSDALVDLPEPGLGTNPYLVITLLLGVPALFGVFLLARRQSQRRRAIVLGLMCVVYGLWSALWGTLFTANWAISDYAELKHNALLWLFWPVDWLLVVYGARLMIKRTTPAATTVWARLTRGLALAHCAGTGILMVLAAVGVVQQAVLPTLASSGLVGLLVYGALLSFAVARET